MMKVQKVLIERRVLDEEVVIKLSVEEAKALFYAIGSAQVFMHPDEVRRTTQVPAALLALEKGLKEAI